MPDYLENVQEPKTYAVCAYITWIGWFCAFFLRNKNSEFTTHHVNQALVINILSILGGIISRYAFLGQTLSTIIDALMLVVWVLGILSAVRGNTKPIPVISDIKIIQ